MIRSTKGFGLKIIMPSVLIIFDYHQSSGMKNRFNVYVRQGVDYKCCCSSVTKVGESAMEVVVEKQVKRGRTKTISVGKARYDLTLDRRVSNRRDTMGPTLEGMQFFDRRRSEDRRQDTRPLNEFPFLPEAIL